MFLFTNDLTILSSWEKHLSSYMPKIIELKEELEELENSFLVCSVEAIDEIDYTIRKLISQGNKILLLDNIPNFSQSKRYLKLGIHGYGNALMSEPFLHSAIMSINEGLVWLHPKLTQTLIQDISKENKNYDETLLENLTPKQKELTLLLKDGLTNAQISQELDVSINTVKTHTKKIYEKLRVNDRLALALLFNKK